MASFELIKSFIEDQQENKHLIKLLRIALLVTLVTGTAVPQGALAFEAELPNAPAQKFIAFVELTDDENANRLSASVIANPTIETKSGDWESKRLAYSPRIVPIETYEPNIDEEGNIRTVLEGEASYYSRAGCLGCNPMMIMANGQPLNDNALTMAIGADRKHLVGHTATVTSLVTGLSVNVKITDTGGFYKERYGNRVADLTIATKQAIGMKGGVGQVRVEVH